jgi:6-phosphogluconolactonase
MTVATDLHAALAHALARRGRAVLAIPGGRSPGPVLTALAARLTEAERRNLHLCWVDERAVPAGHPDRNDGATLAAWRAGGPLPNVHAAPADPGRDPVAAAGAYADDLAAVLAGGPLDAVLLGFGEDGHVASLFPGCQDLDRQEPVFAVIDAPKPPAGRLTMGLTLLARSRRLAIIAPDEVKSRLLHRWWEDGNRQLPITRLIVESAPRTTVYAVRPGGAGDAGLMESPPTPAA